MDATGTPAARPASAGKGGAGQPDDRVGVVIATRDRPGLLARTLHHLGRLPERPAIVVVDNGSRDRAVVDAVGGFPDVALIELAENIGSAARTVGVRALSTPYVAFADDDSWWAAGSLPRAADLMDDDPTLGLIAARLLVGTQERLDPTTAMMSASPLGSPTGRSEPAILGFLACGAVVRRTAYLEVGGFHRRFGVGGEETLVALDLAARGYRLVYVDDVVAHHRPAPSLRDGRPRQQLRNELWTTWLRSEPSEVARRTGALLGRALREPRLLPGVVEALAGLAWVAKERERLPGAVAADLQRLK
jgi:GT2 family glycosyltransferase